MSETERPPQSLVVTLAALTVTGGMLDAVSFLGLGHVFTNNMTGNVILIGFAAAGAPGFSFTASLAAGQLPGRCRGRWPHGPAGRAAPDAAADGAMVLETVLVAVAAVAWPLPSPKSGSGWPRFTVLALLAFSLGAALHRGAAHGRPRYDDEVLTTTLTGLASDSLFAGGANRQRRSAQHVASCAMFVGALVGAVLVLHAGAVWSLGAAAAIVAGTAAFYARQAPLASSSAWRTDRASIQAIPNRSSCSAGASTARQRHPQELHHVDPRSASPPGSRPRPGPNPGRTGSGGRPRCPPPSRAPGRPARRAGG